MAAEIKQIITFVVYKDDTGMHVIGDSNPRVPRGLSEALRCVIEAYAAGADSEALSMGIAISANARLFVQERIRAENARDSAAENESNDVENARDTAGE